MPVEYDKRMVNHACLKCGNGIDLRGAIHGCGDVVAGELSVKPVHFCVGHGCLGRHLTWIPNRVSVIGLYGSWVRGDGGAANRLVEILYVEDPLSWFVLCITPDL